MILVDPRKVQHNLRVMNGTPAYLLAFYCGGGGYDVTHAQFVYVQFRITRSYVPGCSIWCIVYGNLLDKVFRSNCIFWIVREFGVIAEKMYFIVAFGKDWQKNMICIKIMIFNWILNENRFVFCFHHDWHLILNALISFYFYTFDNNGSFESQKLQVRP